MSTCVGTKWIWQKKKSNMELKKTFVSLMATMTVSTHSSQLFQFHQIAHFPSDSKPIIIACNADLIRLRGAQERRCSLNPALICAILSDPNATAISRHTLVLHVNYQRALACWFDEVPKFKRNNRRSQESKRGKSKWMPCHCCCLYRGTDSDLCSATRQNTKKKLTLRLFLLAPSQIFV